MVSDDVIVKNEFQNDGKSIHIYFSEKFNGFVAYGFSAFLAMRTLKDKDIQVQQRYSVEYQMPMVVFGKRQLQELKRDSVAKQGTIEGKYYHIQSSAKMDDEAYSEWAQWLRG